MANGHPGEFRGRKHGPGPDFPGAPAETPDEWGWHRVGMGLASGWHGVGMGLAPGWHRVSTGLAWG
jgi:hypothetical protein